MVNEGVLEAFSCNVHKWGKMLLEKLNVTFIFMRPQISSFVDETKCEEGDDSGGSSKGYYRVCKLDGSWKGEKQGDF